MENALPLKRKDRNIPVFRSQYFVLYFADALYTPFLSLFFASTGLTPYQSGILLALVPFFMVAGDLFFSLFSTSYKRNVFLFRITFLVEALTIALLAYFQSFTALVILISLSSFNNGALFQIQDGAANYACEKNGKEYSSIRIFGSLSYVVALLLSFFLLKYISYSIVFLISACFFLLSFGLSFLLSSYPEETRRGTVEKALWRPLFTRGFILYFIFNALLYGSVSVMAYYLPVYLKGLGISDSQYSLFSSLRVAIEVLTVLLYPKVLKPLFRNNNKTALLVGGFVYALSSAVPLIFSDPYIAIVGNYFLRGVGNGIILVALVAYVDELVGHSTLARGLVIASAGMNIFTGVSNFVSPYVYLNIGYLAMFAILFGLGILGCLILLIPRSRQLKAKLKA